MKIHKKLKKIIGQYQNKDLIIRHTIYYVYSKLNKENNMQNFFDNYARFYSKDYLDVDEKLDQLINTNREEIKEIDPGTMYEKITTLKLKKSLGQVYTPKDIVKKMINMYDFKINKDNSELKILDISCGSGNFLIPIIEKLVTLGESPYEIVTKNIYGVDKDDFSVFLTKLSILLKYPELKEKNLNIIKGDSLIDELKEINEIKFDLIIGNPPYIGHKSISKIYKEKLYEKYVTYKNKSDISYCFFEKSWELLKKQGKLIFITSRYFMEGQDSFEIRKFLKKNYSIIKMIDYNGHNLFKNTNISPIILKISKMDLREKFEYEYKIKDEFKNIEFNQNNLEDKKWIIRPEEQLKLLNKLYEKTNHTLDEVLEFKQGIITGLDKAFIVRNEDIKNYSLEKTLLKKWIKNSNIGKNKIIDINKYKLIYSKDIDINKYPNTKRYLEQFKNRLEKRRECKKGIIEWYELQWPRKKELFEKEKIIFPYKAKEPIFFLDNNSYFCSADIYLGKIKDQVIFYENLVKYLNSSIFDFICRLELKKVGKGLYEFYPYSLKKLPVIKKEDLINTTENGYKDYEAYLNEIFDLNIKEINIIKNTTEEWLND
ncbi:MAG: N-6 DNA methylase [Eubacteriales bacterium]